MSQQDVTNAMILGGMYGPNQYSRYPNGTSLADIQYRGTPTDAYGNPIQPPPGMTLNQTPAQPQQQAAPQASNVNPNQGLIDAIYQSGGQNLGGGPEGTWGGATTGNGALLTQLLSGGGGRYAGAAQPAAQPGASAPVNSYQQALDLLSNPGKVTTPGATVPQSQIGGQPSVLQQFLASRQGGVGAGGYSNQGFFDTLNRLGGNQTASSNLSPGTGLANQLGGSDQALGLTLGKKPAVAGV